MRKRVYSAEEARTMADSITRGDQADAVLRSSLNNTTLYMHSQPAPPIQSTAHEHTPYQHQPQSRRAAAPHSREELELPPSMEPQVSHDIQDMMSALGVNPRKLRVVNRHNNNSSSGSGASVRWSAPASTSASHGLDESTSSSSMDTSGLQLGGVSSAEKRVQALIQSVSQGDRR